MTRPKRAPTSFQQRDYDTAITRGVLFPSPPGAYAPTSGEPFILRPWVRAASEVLFLLLLIVFLCLGAFLGFPSMTSVLERDPSYSYPVQNETVNNAQLLVTVICVPLGIALAVHLASLFSALYLQGLLMRRTTTTTTSTSSTSSPGAAGAPLSEKELVVLRMRRSRLLKQHLKAFLWFVLCWGECFLLAATLIAVLKKIFAYPRPNFFALCNYKGYASALSSGNTAAYLGATDPFRLADRSACQASESDVNSSLQSLVSGHALLSFALLGLLTLYLRAVFSVPSYSYFSLPSFFCAWPLIIASWFAISRVRDRWHRPEDVIIGALLGIMCALMAFEHSYRTHNTSAAAAVAVGTASTAKQVGFADKQRRTVVTNPFSPSASSLNVLPPAYEYRSHNAVSLNHQTREVPALIAAGVEQEGYDGRPFVGAQEGAGKDVEVAASYPYLSMRETKESPIAPQFSPSAAASASLRSRSSAAAGGGGGAVPKRSQPGYRAYVHRQAYGHYRTGSNTTSSGGGRMRSQSVPSHSAAASSSMMTMPTTTTTTTTTAAGRTTRDDNYNDDHNDDASMFRLSDTFAHPSLYHGARPLARLLYYSRSNFPFSIVLLPAHQVGVRGMTAVAPAAPAAMPIEKGGTKAAIVATTTIPSREERGGGGGVELTVRSPMRAAAAGSTTATATVAAAQSSTVVTTAATTTVSPRALAAVPVPVPVPVPAAVSVSPRSVGAAPSAPALPVLSAV